MYENIAKMIIELKANKVTNGLAEAPKYKAILTHLGDVEDYEDVGPSLNKQEIGNAKSHRDRVNCHDTHCNP